MLPWSSGQDVALSRRNQGFDSPWEYQKKPTGFIFLLQGEKLYTTCNFVAEPLNSGKVVKTSLTIDAPLNAFPLGSTKKQQSLLWLYFFTPRGVCFAHCCSCN